MKKRRRSDTAFRIAFVILVVATLVTLGWQFAGRPGGPPRLNPGESAPAKP